MHNYFGTEVGSMRCRYPSNALSLLTWRNEPFLHLTHTQLGIIHLNTNKSLLSSSASLVLLSHNNNQHPSFAAGPEV